MRDAGERPVKSSQDLKGRKIYEAGRQLPIQSNSTQRPAVNAWAVREPRCQDHAFLHCDLSERTKVGCSGLHCGMCLKAKLHGGCK